MLHHGNQWQYKPTNEQYKTGTRLIEMLIETRAKGGNLLLNVGPHPDGYIPLEQEKRLRELALWNFVNGEAIFNTRPWHVSNEGNIWLTRSKDSQTVNCLCYTHRRGLGLRQKENHHPAQHKG
jgi:alpha-L-fucosidase